MQTSPRSWTRRCFEATGLPVAVAGLALLSAISVLFGLQELLAGRAGLIADDPSVLADVRITITHVAVVVYLLAAFVYYERERERAVADLRGLLATEPATEPSAERVWLRWAGLVGLGVAVLTSLFASPGTVSYDPETWTLETAWHRVLGLLIGVGIGRLLMLIVLGSTQLSELAREVHRIDLLDPEPLAPFTRLGLTGALLSIGIVAVFALFLVEVEYLPLVVGLLALSILVGGVALLLPLRGVRDRIRAAKHEELHWCRARLRSARAELAAGRSGEGLEGLIAWEARIQAVPEWPIDASTVRRFGLYLLIPLGSWAGAALVERVIDRLLD